MQAHDAGQPLTQRQVYVVFAGLMTGLALSALDTNVVGVALPTIVGDLGGLNQIAWVGTAYLLTSTAATPLFGKLSDLYGRRQLFQVAIATFAVGSLMCGISRSMGQLVLARGLQGIGGGGLTAMAFVIIADVVPPRERGRYVGFITSVFAVCSVAGPLLGGFFVDHFTWRWIFFINLPLAAVAMVVTSNSLRLPFSRQQRKVDFVGAAILVTGVTTLILMATWAGEGRFPWTSPVIIGMGLATLALGTVFVWWEQRTPEPIVPMRLFRNDVFRVIVPMMVTLGSMVFGASTFMPVFLQAVDGVSATQSGLLLLPLMAGVTISSISAGRITARTGRYRVWPILGTALTVAGTVVLAGLQADSSRLYTSTGLLLMGLGFGMVMPISTLAVQNAVEPRDLGVASSLVTFFRSLGGAVGLAVYGAVFNAKITSSGVDQALLRAPSKIQDLPPEVGAPVVEALADAVQFIYIAAVPVMIVGFVLSFFVKELPLRETNGLQANERSTAAAAAAH